MTGGVVSVIWVGLFVGMFSSLTMDTFQNNIIFSQLAVTYDDDPTEAQLQAAPQHNFMFAVGLTAIDLNANQRYFDITLSNRVTIKNGSSRVKTKVVIPLEPCSLDHWAGVSDNITASFGTLGFDQWLCPPVNSTFTMQGKYTSDSFKYSDIKIGACTENNTLFPSTTCRSPSEVESFLNSFAQFTFNVYYINPVINAGNKDYISYYL